MVRSMEDYYNGTIGISWPLWAYVASTAHSLTFLHGSTIPSPALPPPPRFLPPCSVASSHHSPLHSPALQLSI